ncbi:MAG: redox-sensing transcriptional repressor Rex [Candidatus Aureabacteria bacterium]|nr:redox-sensing transcriptional repressor Rex [Candidatus Auribacterota bacterium]
MDLSDKTIERICRVFGYLDVLEKRGVDFISSRDLALGVGATEYTIRKDISLLNITSYTRKGYKVEHLKKELGKRLHLDQKRKACIVGLGRLGAALLDYERFKEDGFEIVAGFDSNINKLERIRTDIEVFPVTNMEDIIKQKSIELGIIAVPEVGAQVVVDRLISSGIKGILNFSNTKIIVPKNIIYLNIDFTSALRFIASKFITQN